MPKTFEFNSISSVRVKSGGARELGRPIGQLACKRVLVVSDPGVLGTGLLWAALDSLESDRIAFRVFSEVKADPAEAVIHSAVASAIELEADCIVGFGGGSSMDVAKLVALLANGVQQPEHIYGVNQATGEGEKKGVVSPLLFPDIALLDAELTQGLPAPIKAATGIDAMVHAIEAYTIGAQFKVPHGLSNALVLPHVAKFNLTSPQAHRAELFSIIGRRDAGDSSQKAGKFLDYLHALPEELELPTRLRQMGIPEQDIPSLAQDAMKQTRLLVNNPREMTAEAAARIYMEAL